MLSKNERILVEAIRQSQFIEIRLPDTTGGGECRMKFSSKSLCHDIALAVQSHFNRYGK